MPYLILVKEEYILELPEDKLNAPAKEIVRDNSLIRDVGLIRDKDMDILIIKVIPFAKDNNKP